VGSYRADATFRESLRLMVGIDTLCAYPLAVTMNRRAKGPVCPCSTLQRSEGLLRGATQL